VVQRRKPDETIFDSWTPLTFKRQFGSRKSMSFTGDGAGFHVPAWIGDFHTRRMQAYAILRSYVDNAAREFMAIKGRDRIDERREYGDAALLVATVVGALLGEDQQIITEGAEELALEEEQDPGVDAQGNPLPAPDPDPEQEERRREAESAMALQDWLREWATIERLQIKMRETEGLAVGLGDGVYTLGWSPDKRRPRLRIWDPMFYFPVLDDGNEDDFPRKVHIAYEVYDPDLQENQTKIRRITWEMGPIFPVTEPTLAARLLRREADLFDGDTMGDDGRISRVYPWSEEPSFETCYLTDATWVLEQAKSVDDLTGSAAMYATDADGPINRRDLMLDFIPVVHVPNTVAQLNHFGRGLIATVAQILDDLSSADTDLAASSATTGHPVIALQGGVVDKDDKGRAKLTYEPGEILESGDGKLDMLDTSKALDALIGYIEFLLKRLSTNSRVAEALLGRVKPSEVPSGIALQLGFGPTDNMVKEMRLVRSEKNPLILKFAHRIALAAQAAGLMQDVPEEWINSDVVCGSFLPQDQAAAVDRVTALYKAKVISLETAILMLVEVGIPIERVLEEVRRIQERDFEGAAALFDATGDKELVYAYLGEDPPPEPDPEPIVVDPSGAPIPTDPGADPTQFGPDIQPVA
jgi:hypothetical protein